MKSPATADRDAPIRVLVAACGLGAAGGWNVTNIGAAAPVLGVAYGVELPIIGLIAAVLFAVQLATQVPVARLVDRFGCRRMGWWCIATFVGANGLACMAPDPRLAFACRAVMGPAMAIAFVGASAYIRGAGGSSFSQGVFGGVSMGVGGIAIAVVPAMVPDFGWRTPFVGAIAICVLAAVMVSLGPADEGRPGGVEAISVRRILVDSVIRRLSVLQAAAFGLNTVIGNWIGALVERTSDSSARLAGFVGAMTLIAGVVSRPAGGWLSQRYPRHVHQLVGGSLIVGAVATALLAAGPPLPVIVMASTLIGVAAGLPFGPILHCAGRAYPDAPASAVAALNTGAVLVVIVGTPLLGYTFSLPGDGKIGFGALALLWALSVGATSVLKSKAVLGLST
jgi:MFS family permease